MTKYKFYGANWYVFSNSLQKHFKKRNLIKKLKKKKKIKFDFLLIQKPIVVAGWLGLWKINS